MPSFTAQTKIPSDATQLMAFLDSYAQEFGVVERILFSAINKGEKISSFEKVLQVERRLSSQDVRNALTRAEGLHKSQKELADNYIKDCKNAISSIKDSIKKYEKKIKLIKKQGKKAPDKFKGIPSLEHVIHQKRRKLARKEARLRHLERVQKSGDFSVCFGSKRLFKAQHNLKENNYSSHQEWLSDWRIARSSHVFYEGSKRFNNGNLLCRLTVDGQLTITVPPCLQESFGSHVSCNDVFFRYGQEYINHALTPKRYENVNQKTGKSSSRIGTVAPLTHHFIKKNGQWYLHTTVELPEVPYQSRRHKGMLGIDLNPNSVDWSVCDAAGNLRAAGSLRLNIQDKSTSATKDTIGKVCAELVRIAESFGTPIVIEKLDFSVKKASLAERSTKYARMLSNFAYSTFDKMLESRCYKFGIETIRVNPSYSSIQGLTKFMSMYGLNSGTAAALVLARRALRKSERLPRALHVTLKKPVDSFRHVWSAWSAAARVLNTVGGRNRHLFYTQRREANSLLEVTLVSLRAGKQGRCPPRSYRRATAVGSAVNPLPIQGEIPWL